MDRDVSLVRDKLKTPRAAAIAGVIFSTLLILIDVLIRKSIPANPLGSATQLIEHSKALSLVLRLAPFAGIAFLWFIAVIRDRLGNRQDRFFATVFLGSGLVYLAMMLVCAAIGRALLLVLETEPERVIQSGAYAIGQALTYEIFHIYAIRIAAVFMASVSTTMLRTQIGPRVLAFLGYVLALVLLFGVETFDWASLAFPLWALLISVLIMIESSAGARILGTSRPSFDSWPFSTLLHRGHYSGYESRSECDGRKAAASWWAFRHAGRAAGRQIVEDRLTELLTLLQSRRDEASS